MADKKEEKKPVVKRIKGEAYWALYDLLKEGEALITEYGEWARKECRRLNLIPDVTDLTLGVIWNIPQNMVTPELPRRQVANVEDEDVIKAAIEHQHKVNEVNEKIDAVKRQIAMRMNVRIDQINAPAGIVTMDSEDVESVDVDLTDK